MNITKEENVEFIRKKFSFNIKSVSPENKTISNAQIIDKIVIKKDINKINSLGEFISCQIKIIPSQINL